MSYSKSQNPSDEFIKEIKWGMIYKNEYGHHIIPLYKDNSSSYLGCLMIYFSIMDGYESCMHLDQMRWYELVEQ